mgnify:CR=1 FL=1
MKIVRFAFLGDAVPCEAATDADDTETSNVTDTVYLVDYLFRGGPRPPHPFPKAGRDNLTPSELTCLGDDE